MSQKFMSLKGKLLLDSGELIVLFHQSAVYICEHDEEGAVGLVLNHPISVKLRRVGSEYSGSVSTFGGENGRPVMQKSILSLALAGQKDSFREVVPTFI